MNHKRSKLGMAGAVNYLVAVGGVNNAVTLSVY